MADYKYKTQIDKLIALGAVMPKVHEPNDLYAYRYIFANDKRGANHIPPFVMKPERAVVKPDKKIPPVEGFALSCYTDSNKAVEAYHDLVDERPMLCKQLGDTLCSGLISNNDGNVTEPNAKTHFELFEFAGCDPNRTFTTIEKTLI
jgi:hypothetical protein